MKKARFFEAWADSERGPISFTTEEGIRELRSKGLISADAILLHRIAVDTFEEAMAVHYIKMGWKPYVPSGAPAECPNQCGSQFYPDGSGECPNCGKVW